MMTDVIEQQLLAVIKAYRAAVLAKDVEGFVALYDRDVCIFDLWAEWSCEGLTAWRMLVSQWFGGMGENRDVVDFNHVHTLGGPDHATVHAFISFRCLSPEGKELRAMQERLTWSLIRKEEGWKIVHQHTSAPIDFKTFKVILQR
jgi:uncharacterized protein (TIGR02246 family)